MAQPRRSQTRPLPVTVRVTVSDHAWHIAYFSKRRVTRQFQAKQAIPAGRHVCLAYYPCSTRISETRDCRPSGCCALRRRPPPSKTCCSTAWRRVVAELTGTGSRNRTVCFSQRKWAGINRTVLAGYLRLSISFDISRCCETSR